MICENGLKIMASNTFNSAPCMWMRGGTSKAGYFLASDLPQSQKERDSFLLRIMGSPDPLQIDGMGGADPLTSKVAIVSPSSRKGVDVDYLFLQIMVDKAKVSDTQNCGNILAGVGPFSIERGLVQATDNKTEVSIYMQNTQQVAVQSIHTIDGCPIYAGNARIDGVPGSASPTFITFRDIAGSTCGSLLPSGNKVDVIDGITLTCIDNGMPVVLLPAEDMGISGEETREQLEANSTLRRQLESIRIQAGQIMNLGDVTEKTVPKMTLISHPKHGGTLSTRSFIPHRCHASIGALGAISVATACTLSDSPANKMCSIPEGSQKTLRIEHPSGETTVTLDFDTKMNFQSAAILRTARKLFDGIVYA